MSRSLRFLILFLTLSLLFAACRPQTADRRPQADGRPLTVNGSQPTVPSPTFTLSPSPTPTETPIPQPSLESLGLFAETQALLQRQGWDIAWDAQNARYLIRQRAFDEASQSFTSQLTHEVGYIDLEGNLHFTATYYSASENEDGTWKDTSTTQNIVIDLKNLPKNPNLIIQQQLDENGNPISFQEKLKTPGFHLLETKNPAFEKTGILALTYLDENGIPQTVTFNRNLEHAIPITLSSFSETDETFQGIPTFLPWEAIHSDAPLHVQLAIINGYDRPFDEKVRSTFEGWKLRFEAYPGLRKSESDPLPAVVFLTYAPLYLNNKPAYTYDQSPMRYAVDENGNLPLFYTIAPIPEENPENPSEKIIKHKRLVYTLKQLYNPKNIADKNRPADETLIISATFGALTDEQIQKLPALFNHGLPTNPDAPDKGLIAPMRTSEFPTVILAAQGNIFKLIAADPQNAFLISAAQERATGQVNLLLGYLAVMGKNFSIASLDSLLGMEGNDVNNVRVYSADGNGTYKLETALAIGYDLLKSSNVAEVVVYDQNGNIVPFYLDSNLQQCVLVISP
jgi:hypothetical protein